MAPCSAALFAGSDQPLDLRSGHNYATGTLLLSGYTAAATAAGGQTLRSALEVQTTAPGAVLVRRGEANAGASLAGAQAVVQAGRGPTISMWDGRLTVDLR